MEDRDKRGARKRVYVWAGLVMVAVLGAGALVFASVPHSFATGETLTADNLNGNFMALDQRLSALEALLPAGTIIAFGGPDAAGADAGTLSTPSGWLLCDGSPVSRTAYASLFRAVGTNFGAGDGVNSFNLPDLRGRFLRGTDHGAGRDPDVASRTATNGGSSGDRVGSVQADQFRAHHHTLNELGSFTVGPPYDTALTGSGGFAQDTGVVLDTGGAETRPVNVAVNYLIKL